MCDCVTVASLSALGRVLARRQVADLCVSVLAASCEALWKKKFSLCIAGHIVYIALNTLVVISIFRHEYVSAFFDFISFGVQCTNQECKQFIRTLYFLGIDFLKNIGTGACFLTLKIQGTSEMSHFDSVLLIRQKKIAQHSPLFYAKKNHINSDLWIHNFWFWDFVDPQKSCMDFCGSTKVLGSFQKLLWIHSCVMCLFVFPQFCNLGNCGNTNCQDLVI